ncbi:MAG: BRCT domain-containing protein [Gallionella sp.]|nr:BRCT domain-containing protein [Gallionella sp.]
MHPDHLKYAKFTTRAQLEKSVNSLLGIIEGVSIDGAINVSEYDFLHLWLSEHAELQDRHPFNELVPVVQAAMTDGVLTQDEQEDIIWLCERLRSTEYYDKTTADLQRLHAMLGGIVADGHISEEELRGLSSWLQDHEHLKTCWPYDEIESLIIAVLADKKIDEQEHKMLKDFFSEFIAVLDGRTIVSPSISEDVTLVGLCAVCPEIEFEGSKFCFTGASTRYTRSQLAEIVNRLGGEVVPSMSAKVSYLIIGADGNPCWAYACYGRKVEKAVELRKSGTRLLIVHENDFHDAVADCE